MIRLLVLPLLLLAIPAAAQEPCPWGGAVTKVNGLPQDIEIHGFTEAGLVGRVPGHPDCTISKEAVKAAAALASCAAYQGRPDALGLEMVAACLLEKTGGNPPAGSVIEYNPLAAQELLQGQ